MKAKKNKNASLVKSKGGKNIRNARTKIVLEKLYSLDDAFSILKDCAFTKFDQTIEVAMKLGVDPKHSDQMVRGMVSLPHGNGKTTKVAVLTKGAKVKEAQDANADIVGAEDLIEEIKSGKINFDVLIATPDMMGLIGSVAKILGPKGKMPNPKLGTVTLNVADAVKSAKAGQVEFRVEKGGIIHAGFGKASFDNDKLKTNLTSLYNAVIKARPTGSKGTYMKEIYICSTMGPSLKIDITSIQ